MEDIFDYLKTPEFEWALNELDKALINTYVNI